MADYIDRQAAIDAVCNLPTWYGDEGCLPFGDPQPPMEALMYPEDVVSAINNLPSADVKLVVKGQWLDEAGNVVQLDSNGVPPTSVWCSECGEWLTASDEYGVKGRWCPNCGADMREVQP